MKRALYLTALVLAVVTIAAIGCQTDTDKQERIEIRLASIHEVQVNITESFPEQIFAYIKGGLADSCTTFHELITERSGNTINIQVTIERPRNAICIQIYSYFEQNIALGSDFTRGESYTINVNGTTTNFDYPG